MEDEGDLLFTNHRPKDVSKNDYEVTDSPSDEDPSVWNSSDEEEYLSLWMKGDSCSSEPEEEPKEPRPDPEDTDRNNNQYKKACDMTDDELVELCMFYDRPRARQVVDKLRKYLIQLSESEGFDIDEFPGCFFGVTSIVPGKCSWELHPEYYAYLVKLAKLAIAAYNQAHESEFEVVQVEKVNELVSMYCSHYLTFSACDVKTGGHDPSADRKTFQAIVLVNLVDDKADKEVHFCRLRPN